MKKVQDSETDFSEGEYADEHNYCYTGDKSEENKTYGKPISISGYSRFITNKHFKKGHTENCG